MMASLAVAVGWSGTGNGVGQAVPAHPSDDIGRRGPSLYTGPPKGEVAEWLKALAC